MGILRTPWACILSLFIPGEIRLGMEGWQHEEQQDSNWSPSALTDYLTGEPSSWSTSNANFALK
jgi:hypothetical protein